MLTRDRIKNIPFSRPVDLTRLVRYRKGTVVSRSLAQNDRISMTLFAFDRGEELRSHVASGDVMVHVLEGEVLLNIAGKDVTAGPGQVVVIPAAVPHEITAATRATLLFTVVE